MKIVFWISLIGILYAYLGYPALMWLLARFSPRPWKTAPANSSIRPSVSIVLAVYNGIAMLPAKIQHLLTLDYPNIQEIVIVSDGSTDGTAELLASQQDPRLKTVALRENSGKAVAVNAGLELATADIVLFTDIRPEIAPGAIQQLVANFADPEVGCVAGELALRQDGHDGATGAVSGLYWRYEQWIRKCEAAFDSPVGVYGGFYAIRRQLAVAQPPGMILDDMFEPLAIIRQGYRSVLDPKAVVYDTWPKEGRSEFHRKVRTLAGNFQLFQLAPWTLTTQNRVLFQLVSHKIVRLIVPYLMVLLLISMIALSWGPSPASPSVSWIYASLAAAQVFVLALAVTGLRFRVPVFNRIASPASAMLVLNTAAVVGLYKFLFTRGPLWKIWNSGKPKPASPAQTRKDLAAETLLRKETMVAAAVVDAGKQMSQ